MASEDPAAPAPRSRRRADLFIALYLAAQVALPLSYYAGLRAPTDERFAWRMFSSVRLSTCEVEVSERAPGGAARTVSLPRILQEAWIHDLRRGQPRVVDAFLRRRCEEGGVATVTLTRRCKATDGTAPRPETIARTCGSSP